MNNRVIPSDRVNDDSLGEQRERDNVCEDEKKFLCVKELGILGRSKQKYEVHVADDDGGDDDDDVNSRSSEKDDGRWSFDTPENRDGRWD